MRRPGALVIFAAVLLTACGSSTARPSPVRPTTVHPTPVRTFPPVPAGGTDCGITDEMSGWPTTTVPGPVIATCLADAFGSGRPARLVVIRPSTVTSGRVTSDGYPIPAGILVTYRVLGPGQLQVTTDRHEAGGAVTTQNCTGLAPLAAGSLPDPTGCTPG